MITLIITISCLFIVSFYVFCFYRTGMLDRDFNFLNSLRNIMKKRKKDGQYDYEQISLELAALNEGMLFKCERVNEFLLHQELNEKYLLAKRFRYVKEYKEYIKELTALNKHEVINAKRAERYVEKKKKKGIRQFMTEADYNHLVSVLCKKEWDGDLGGMSETVMIIYYVLLKGNKFVVKPSPGSFGTSMYYEFLLDVDLPMYPDSYKNSYSHICDSLTGSKTNDSDRIKKRINDEMQLLGVSFRD